MSYLRRYAPAATLALAIVCLYLYGLARVGVLDPDEPRYLAIGRSMAATGDFVTPRLWGGPWFEKPPLLYWMVSLGTCAGLGPELSGRLPIALLSLGFLITMWILLRREMGVQAATVATALLATSAGWLAYSSLAVTDLPLAVFFSLAVFIALPLAGGETAPGSVSPTAQPVTRFFLLGVFLGLSVLAKGLVPLVLAVPLAWFLRRHWRYWPLAFTTGLAVAAPWYVAVYLRYGTAFVEEFFWKQHFSRLYSASLQHVQGWYYYLPVLLAALFPWTPLFGLLGTHKSRWDRRSALLASCVVFGLLFFSVSLNKLPGYLLPLLPAGFALLGASVNWEQVKGSQRIWLLPCAVLIGLLPLIAQALPETLAAGRLTVPHHLHLSKTSLFYSTAPVLVVVLARRSWAPILLILCLVGGGLFLKIVAYPVLDTSVSARGVWRRIKDTRGTICEDWLNRDLKFGLALYRGTPYPPCDGGKYDFVLRSRGRTAPLLEKSPDSGTLSR